MAEGINHTDFELLYLLAGLFVLLNAAISWLVFAQGSMRPLERKLRELKSDNISDWDGPGWRHLCDKACVTSLYLGRACYVY